MESRPLVSVIIPTYNYGHFVADAVESALAQTYPNLEVIVIDDGSTDNTQDVLKRFAGRITPVYKKNAGLSAARNTGIDKASGEYIAVLDSDDVWLPQKIERQMAVFAAVPGLGVVSCAAYEVNNDLTIINQLVYVDYEDEKAFLEMLLRRNIVSGGSSALVKKECFDRVGGFDEDLRSAEDWDMWLRISQYYRVRIVAEPLVKIRVGSSTMSSVKHAGRMLDNELLVLNKQLSVNPYFRENLGLQRVSFGYRHYRAAWAFYQGHEDQKALSHLRTSFLYHPWSFLKKEQGIWTIKILLGTLLRLFSAQQRS